MSFLLTLECVIGAFGFTLTALTKTSSRFCIAVESVFIGLSCAKSVVKHAAVSQRQRM